MVNYIPYKNTFNLMAEISVFVDSRGGNTRMVADAIAGELGTAVGDITAPLPDEAKLLFLGSGTYGGRPGEVMAKFIAAGNFTGRKVALFGTSGAAAGAEKMIAAMTEPLAQKGATVLGSWHCRGRTFIVNWGHPDTEDLASAKKFAQEMLAKR